MIKSICKLTKRATFCCILSIVFALFSNVLTIYSQQPAENIIVVDNPPFSVCTHPSVVIDKIELKDAETVLYMTIHQKKGWVQIASDTYIRANGQKYIVKSSDGIELDKEVYSDSSGKIVFALHFPAIDLSTQQIDFIESDCDNCFKIWGVELKPGISAKYEKIPEKIKKESIIEDDGKSLAIPQLKYGEAIFKGKFLGYVPEMNWKIEMFVNNPVTCVQEELETQVKDDGSFELKVPLVTTMQVLFRTAFYNKYILLSPGKETTVYVDLHQKSCQETKNQALKCPSVKYIYFGGENAEINNQMEDINIAKIESDFIDQCRDFKVIVNMSVEEHKAYVLDKMNQAIEKLSQKNLTKKAYEFAVIDIHFKAMHRLIFADSDLEEAYRKEHKLDYESDMIGFLDPIFDKTYYSYLKEFSLNSPYSLYSSDFSAMVNSYKYLSRRRNEIIYPTKAIYQELIGFEKLSPEERKYAKYLQANTIDSWSDEKQLDFKVKTTEETQKLIASGKLNEGGLKLANDLLSLYADSGTDIYSAYEKKSMLIIYLYNKGVSAEEINSIFGFKELDDFENEDTPKLSEEAESLFRMKYEKAFDQFTRKKRINYLADILGDSQGIVFDMIDTQLYCSKFKESTPLSTNDLENISQIKNLFYFDYITQKNNELLAQIEKNKNKKGYNIYDVPETDDEKLFAEILKPFAGKVVFVDFWATWCAPCRSAMKRFESTKKQLKEKDVVFVYLTDESSPLTAWQNMIPDIPGEHFRLKSDQFKYLKKKFGATGVPSYLILNKEGEQIYFRVGFEGSEKLEKVITGAL